MQMSARARKQDVDPVKSVSRGQGCEVKIEQPSLCVVIGILTPTAVIDSCGHCNLRKLKPTMCCW